MAGYFPIDLDLNNVRYVFFNSLFDESKHPSHATYIMARRTGYMAQDYLTQQVTKGEKNFDTINKRIDNVISLVKAIADIEYKKEQAYIDSMKSKIDTSLFNIVFPDSPEGNWQEFIFLLNFVRTNSTDFFNKVREERDRLRENRKYINDLSKNTKLTEKEKERARKGYARTSQYQITTYLSTLVNQMFGKGKTTRNSYANVIKDYIIKENWNRFLEYKNGSFNLNEADLNALIFSMVQLIFQNTLNSSKSNFTEIFKDANSYTDRMTRLEEYLQDENNREMMGFNRVKSILDSPISSKIIATGFARKLEMKVKNGENLVSNAKKTVRGRMNKEFVGSISDIAEDSKKELINLLNTSQFITVRSELYQPTDANWLIIEAQELLKFDTSNGEISISLGDSQIKADNFFIKTDFEINESIFSEIEKRVQEKYKVAYEKLAEDENISTENWKKRQAQLDSLDEELAKILKEEGNLKDLSNSFIIETSDKIYESFNVNMNAFSGGRFGGDLISQLEKIDAIASTGGLSIGDLNWLVNACINSNSSAIGGEELKSSLENYLSLIGSAILFDDSEAIFEQTAKNIEQAVSSTKPNKIHLFYLQGFMYYPLSQILYAMYDKMSRAKQEIESTIERGGGAKVKINYSDFPKDLAPYEDLTQQTWEDTGAAAISATKLELTFLGSFISMLNSLINI